MLAAEMLSPPRSSQAQHGLLGLGVPGPTARTCLAPAGVLLATSLLYGPSSGAGVWHTHSKADTSLVPER